MIFSAKALTFLQAHPMHHKLLEFLTGALYQRQQRSKADKIQRVTCVNAAILEKHSPFLLLSKIGMSCLETDLFTLSAVSHQSGAFCKL